MLKYRIYTQCFYNIFENFILNIWKFPKIRFRQLQAPHFTVIII